LAEFLKQSLWFPVIQSIHLIGLTMLVGTIAIRDLQLLGFGLRRRVEMAPWIWAGLIVVVITGPVMFWSDMPRYLANPAFLVKMPLLLLALLTQLAPQGRISAVLSLALWSSVILAGRAIADFDVF
jgi:hypothetical protein